MSRLAAAALHLGSTEDAYDWRDYGLCRTRPDLDWFPARGDSTREIKAVCRECPVESICLDVALANGEKFGVWGGTSERERRRLRRARNQSKEPA